MATAPAPKPAHASPFRPFDDAVTRVLGVDMRLIYGFAVPILMVCGLIVLLGFAPSPWMVASVLVFELCLLAVVAVGFAGLLNETDDEDEGEPN